MSKSDTDDGQLHLFRDAARQLECDDEVKFAATLRTAMQKSATGVAG